MLQGCKDALHVSFTVASIALQIIGAHGSAELPLNSFFFNSGKFRSFIIKSRYQLILPFFLQR